MKKGNGRSKPRPLVEAGRRLFLGTALRTGRASGFGIGATLHAAGSLRRGALLFATGLATGEQQRGRAQRQGEQFDHFHWFDCGFYFVTAVRNEAAWLRWNTDCEEDTRPHTFVHPRAQASSVRLMQFHRLRLLLRPHAEVERLHADRKRHREVDVALRNFLVETFGHQRATNQKQET